MTGALNSELDRDQTARFLDIGGRRVIEGLIAGAGTGVLLTGVVCGGAAFVFTPGLAAIGAGLFVFTLATCAAIVPWFLGVFVFGPPIWMLGHRLGWTKPWVFALVGAVTPFTIMAGPLAIVLMADPSDAKAILSNLGVILFVSALGPIVGLVAQRVAYRR